MLHQVGVSFDLYYDARKHNIKISYITMTITIRFHENPSNDSRHDACGQTDRHEEAQKHFLIFTQTRLSTSHPTYGPHFMRTFRTKTLLEVRS